MKKTRTLQRRRQGSLKELPASVTVQMPLPMISMLNDVQQGFHTLCIEAGRQAWWRRQRPCVARKNPPVAVGVPSVP